MAWRRPAGGRVAVQFCHLRGGVYRRAAIGTDADLAAPWPPFWVWPWSAWKPGRSASAPSCWRRAEPLLRVATFLHCTIALCRRGIPVCGPDL